MRVFVNRPMHAIVTHAFNDCFIEIGKLHGVHLITKDPIVPPVVHPHRQLPILSRAKVDKELKKDR